MERPSAPVWEKFNVAEAVVRSVDRVVVDGLVDGRERRARLRTLARIAFNNATAPRPIFFEFVEGLSGEPRYLDRVEDRFGYRQVVDLSKDVRPSLIAIVKGVALYSSEEEQEAAFDRMDSLTRRVYDHELSRSQKGILTTGQVAKIVGEVGTDIEVTAFFKYVEKSSRFYRHRDGQIVLTEMYPNGLPVIAEIPRLKNVRAVLNNVLPHVRTNEQGKFNRTAVLAALRGMGVEVPMDQLSEVFNVLATLDHIIPQRDFGYKFR